LAALRHYQRRGRSHRHKSSPSHDRTILLAGVQLS
jgi:hypothetical protein